MRLGKLFDKTDMHLLIESFDQDQDVHGMGIGRCKLLHSTPDPRHFFSYDLQIMLVGAGTPYPAGEVLLSPHHAQPSMILNEI